MNHYPQSQANTLQQMGTLNQANTLQQANSNSWQGQWQQNILADQYGSMSISPYPPKNAFELFAERHPEVAEYVSAACKLLELHVIGADSPVFDPPFEVGAPHEYSRIWSISHPGMAVSVQFVTGTAAGEFEGDLDLWKKHLARIADAVVAKREWYQRMGKKPPQPLRLTQPVFPPVQGLIPNQPVHPASNQFTQQGAYSMTISGTAVSPVLDTVAPGLLSSIGSFLGLGAP